MIISRVPGDGDGERSNPLSRAPTIDYFDRVPDDLAAALKEWRQSMSPAVFEAFVSFVGIIPGTLDLDVVAACDNMWEHDNEEHDNEEQASE